MAMLGRYQKAGGFVQLLKLIETCGKQKQDSFLKIVTDEDPRWADAIRQRMLTIDRIFSWPDDTVTEISGRLQPITMATAKHGLPAAQWTRLMKTHSHSQVRSMDDLANSKTPTAAEISAAFVKILEEVRAMMQDGSLRIEKFAPELVIEDDIENLILGGSPAANGASGPDADPAPNLDGFGPPPPGADLQSIKDLNNLKVRFNQLQQEVGFLKTENKVLKERLTQIKKLVA
jgi:hypothetical protein